MTSFYTATKPDNNKYQIIITNSIDDKNYCNIVFNDFTTSNGIISGIEINYYNQKFKFANIHELVNCIMLAERR